MKNVMLMTLVLCLAAGVQAEVFFTVDEEMDAGPGWMNVTEADCTVFMFGSEWANADLRVTPSGTTVADDYQVLLQANTNAYEDNLTDPYWVDQTTLLGNKCMEANFYTEVDELDGETIVFKYRVVSNDLEIAGYRTQAFIKVLDAGGGWATTQEVYLDLEVGVGSLTLDVTTGADPRVQCGFVVQGLNVAAASTEASLGVVVVPHYDRVTNPNPADGADVPLNLATLSWTNADPNNLGDTISCTVYVDTDASFLSPHIASGITAGTVNIADLTPLLTLVDGPIYYWRVDSTDSNGGSPITLTGPVWTFQVGDIPPVVDAGLNQYVWLDGGTATFTLSGSYGDDGKSEITRADFVEDAHETDPATIVTFGAKTWNQDPNTIHTDGEVTQEVTVDGNGWFAFNLEVEDNSGVGTDEGVDPVVTPHDEPGVNAGVYGTCIEAAQEDPDDDLAGRYPNGHGDIDGDCDTDLEDFAILAGSWIECMTPKAGC